MDWHLLVFPEISWSGNDPDALPSLEQALDELQQVNQTQERSLIRVALGRLLSIKKSSSRKQICRYWYLLGRANNMLRNWERACEAFNQCVKFLDRVDKPTEAIIMRAYALALSMNGHQEESISYYEYVITLWKLMPPNMQQSCLEEDADAYLCNTYRQLAQSWLDLGAIEVAHNLIENQMIPIVEDYFSRQSTSWNLPAASSTEKNWRSLHCYGEWLRSLLMAYRIHFTDEQVLYSEDIHIVHHSLLEAIEHAKMMPETQGIVPDMLTSAAELMLQRCSVTPDSLVQLKEALCATAYKHLDEAKLSTYYPSAMASDQLRAHVLHLPEIELRYRRARLNQLHINSTNIPSADILAVDLLTELKLAVRFGLSNPDASHRVFAARCLLLMGTIEKDRIGQDPSARERSMHYLQAGLQLFKRPNAQLIHIIEREILREIGQADSEYPGQSLHKEPTMTEPSAPEYLHRAISLIRLHAYYADRIDWAEARAAADQVLPALAPAARYAWIRELLARLGDHHSSLVEPAEAHHLHAEEAAELPTGALLDSRIAVLQLPRVVGDEEHPSRYATALHGLLRELMAAGARRWVVDLRHNAGGNLGPMLAGIGPLLGAAVVGGFRSRDGQVAAWRYAEGAIGLERWILARAAPPFAPQISDPVAVLTGPQTRSAGELTLVAFRGRPATRTFGAPTAGVPTSNEVLTLPDGAELFLMTGLGTDRTEQSYDGPLAPDEPIPLAENLLSQADDVVLQAACTWLVGLPEPA